MKKKLIILLASLFVAGIVTAFTDSEFFDPRKEDGSLPTEADLQQFPDNYTPATSLNGKPYGLEEWHEGMTVEEMKKLGTDPNRAPGPSSAEEKAALKKVLATRSSVANKDAKPQYQISTFTVGAGEYVVNGVNTKDVAPYIKDGSVLLPLRYVAYALGKGDNSILWDNDTSAVALRYDKVTKLLETIDTGATKEVFSNQATAVVAQVGSKKMMANGEEIELEVAPEITEGRLMLPLRAITEIFGCGAYWDEETKTVYIAAPKTE